MGDKIDYCESLKDKTPLKRIYSNTKTGHKF